MWRNTSRDDRNKQFCKKFFSSTIWDSKIFHYFCKVRACRISVKNSIFQKLPKIVEKHFSRWQEQIILPKKYFLALFEMVLNFHYFCKGRACRISVKNSILQELPKIVEKHFSRWQEQIILQKNISLALFEIVQNFHYFGKVAPVEFLSKIRFYKNCLKLWRNISRDDRNK